MRFARKTIVLPVVVALLALASGYACGDDAPPAVSAVVSTPTPTPSVQSPSVLPVSTPTPEFGAARESEAAQPRDVSAFRFFSGNPGDSA